MLQQLTSPSTLNSEDLPQPLGPQTRTLTPELTSNDMLSTSTSPFGVTKGTSSNLKTSQKVLFYFYCQQFHTTNNNTQQKTQKQTTKQSNKTNNK